MKSGLKCALITFLLLMFSLNFFNAADFTPQGDINLRDTYNIENALGIDGVNATFDNNVTADIFVGSGSFLTGIISNSSDYWDSMDSINLTQMENSGGVLNILPSWLRSLFYIKAEVTTNISSANTTAINWVDALFPRISELVGLIGNWSADQTNYYNKTEVTANITSANSSMGAYVDSQDTSFNNTMKTYVDAQDTVFNNSIAAYVDILNTSGLIKDWNATGYIINWNSTGYIKNWQVDITSTNSTMKTYVDSQDVVFNSSMKAYVDALDTTTNTTMKSYVDAQDATYNSSMKAYVDLLNVSGLIIDWNSTGYIINWNASGDIKDWDPNDYIKDWNGTIGIYNSSMKAYVDSQDIAYNTTLTNYVDAKLITTYYNATQSQVVVGTIDGGNLTDTQHPDGAYDSVTFNFSEESGTPGLDLRINFTGIADFSRGVMRYKTGNLLGDYPIVQLWNYDDSVWEDYPLVGESQTFATMTQPVFDDSDHISGEIVQMRIYKAGQGFAANHYYVDWIAISSGPGVPSGQETDPFSFHRDENLNNSGYNITADYFFGNGSQLIDLTLTESDPYWSGNQSSYYNKTEVTTNITSANTSMKAYVDLLNVSGYIMDWNATEMIIDWNASFYIIDWNATSLIANWSNVIGSLSEVLWNANYSDYLVTRDYALNATGITWGEATNTTLMLTADWNTNYTANNLAWLNTTNLTYNAYNSSGLIRDWNVTGDIADWNATGYIKNWNATGWIADWNASNYIIDWNATGYIANWGYLDDYWNANYSTFLTHIASLVADTTPQLGGYLDTNSQNIGSTSDEIENIYIGTNSRIYFGDGQEFSQYYNGTYLITG